MAKTLIVTASPPLSRRLSALMIDNSLEHFVAHDSETATVQFRHVKPELVVIDVVMPDLPGLEIGQGMLFEKTDTRLVMMSDIDTRKIRDLGLRYGIRDMLIKPFTDAEFLFTVKKYLEDFNAESA